MDPTISQQGALARKWNTLFSSSGISFSVDRSRGGVVVAELNNSQGGVARVSTTGAHLLSASMSASGQEIFYLSSKSKYPPVGPIRGGNPLVLGWFGGREGFPSHGFGRMLEWIPVATSNKNGAQSLILETGSATLRQHPLFRNDETWGSREFTARLELAFSSNRIEQTVRFTNTGPGPFDFQAGFHPYFRVSNYRQVSVKGLEELAHLDSLNNRTRQEAVQHPISFSGALDRIYLPQPMANVEHTSIVDAEFEREIIVGQHGLSHWVVWNPGDEKQNWKEDIDGNDGFVCVEPMHAIGMQTLSPNATAVFGLSIAEVSCPNLSAMDPFAP